MTLRMDQVSEKLPGVVARYREQLDAWEAGLAAAAGTLAAWDADQAEGNARIETAMAENPRPYATAFREPPALARDVPPFAPVTVVAADGSSIEPDRFAAVQCFVVNTGTVALPYGTGDETALFAEASIGPRRLPDEGEDHGREELGPFSWGVNLHRDVAELDALSQHASATTGETVALVDGTLLPWDLDSPRVAPSIRATLFDEAVQAFALLKAHGERIALGAYVSGSRASDVVQSLRALHGEGSNWPLSDSPLFAGMLAHGQRSAVFRSRSERREQVENLFRDRKIAIDVCFFYIRIGGDLARVELPAWSASDAQVDRLHATLVQQCDDCGGYPRALQEAHEQAVISMGDRLQFDRLLESESGRQGLWPRFNSKQMSKRRRAI